MRARALAAVLLAVAAGGCAHLRPSPPSAVRLADHLSGMIWPLPVSAAGQVTSAYGPRASRHHDGLDLGGRAGDPIHAVSDGTVRFSGWRSGYGQTLIVDHGNGVTTLYAHASALYARAGERVVRGQPIAAVGATGNATGNHLHFEIAWAGRPIDPVPLLPRLRDR